MREIEMTQLAIDAVHQTGLPVWAGYSCVMIDREPWLYNRTHRLADALKAIDGQPIELLSIMHTQMDDVDACLDVVQQYWPGPVGVYAHVGDHENWSWRFDASVTPEFHTAKCLEWIGRGVQVVGGCCGIGPAHIEHLRTSLTATS